MPPNQLDRRISAASGATSCPSPAWQRNSAGSSPHRSRGQCAAAATHTTHHGGHP
jgi:hypothetical protein